ISEHVAADRYSSPLYRTQPGDQLERGRLSRTRWTKQHDGASVGRERHVEVEGSLPQRGVELEPRHQCASRARRFERRTAPNAMATEIAISAAAWASCPVSVNE